MRFSMFLFFLSAFLVTFMRTNKKKRQPEKGLMYTCTVVHITLCCDGDFEDLQNQKISVFLSHTLETL